MRFSCSLRPADENYLPTTEQKATATQEAVVDAILVPEVANAFSLMQLASSSPTACVNI